MQLVKVNYVHGDEVQEGRAYTYFSEETLAVGDKVEVLVRDTVGRAVVCEVDVPLDEILKFRDKVKIIPAGAKEKPTIPEGKPGDDWKEIKPLGPFTNTPDGEGTWLDKPDPNAWRTGDEEVRTGEPGSFNCPADCHHAQPEGCEVEDRLEPGGTYEQNDSLPMCPEYMCGIRTELPYSEGPTEGEVCEQKWAEAKTEETKLATIRVRPQQDPAVFALSEQAERLRDIALERRIVCDADLSPATEDLSVIAQVKKGLAAIKTEYVKPIKGHLDDVNAAFNMILKPLEEADSITRAAILAYRAAAQKRAAEAEAINRQAEELARKQAEFSGTGEFTVDTTPKVAPAVVDKVRTDIGSAGVMKVTKWELVDKAAVPEDYKILDAAKITKIVKAGGSIPGIRVYTEDTLRVNTR